MHNWCMGSQLDSNLCTNSLPLFIFKVTKTKRILWKLILKIQAVICVTRNNLTQIYLSQSWNMNKGRIFLISNKCNKMLCCTICNSKTAMALDQKTSFWKRKLIFELISLHDIRTNSLHQLMSDVPESSYSEIFSSFCHLLWGSQHGSCFLWNWFPDCHRHDSFIIISLGIQITTHSAFS